METTWEELNKQLEDMVKQMLEDLHNKHEAAIAGCPFCEDQEVK